MYLSGAPGRFAGAVLWTLVAAASLPAVPVQADATINPFLASIELPPALPTPGTSGVNASNIAPPAWAAVPSAPAAPVTVYPSTQTPPVQRAETAPAPPPGATQSGAAQPGASQPAPAQPVPPRRKRSRFSKLIARLQLGVRPTYSNLLSARTRNAFGNGGLSIKPSYFRLSVPVRHDDLGWDYGLDRRKFGDNRMTMLSLGAGYRHNFHVMEPEDPDATDEEKAAWRARLGTYPYVALGLNVLASKLQVPSENIDTDFRLGLGATLTAGYQYKRLWRLQSSITGQTSVAGYNFSSMRVAFDYKM